MVSLQKLSYHLVVPGLNVESYLFEFSVAYILYCATIRRLYDHEILSRAHRGFRKWTYDTQLIVTTEDLSK